MANIESDKLLDEREAAELIGVSPSTLNSWRVRRVGPRFLKIGRLVKYRTSAISAWIDAQEIGTSDQPKGAGGQ